MFRKVGWLALGFTAWLCCSACKSNSYDKPPDPSNVSSMKGTGTVPSTEITGIRANPSTSKLPKIVKVRSNSENDTDDTELLLNPVKVDSLPDVFDKKKTKGSTRRKKKENLGFGMGGLQMDSSMKGLMQPSGSLLGGSLTLSTGFKGSMDLDSDDGDGKGDKPSPRGTTQPSSRPAPRRVPTSRPVNRKQNPQPAARQPAARQPAARQPAARQPAARQPAARQPAARQPAARRLVRVSPGPTRMGMPGLNTPFGGEASKAHKIPKVLAKVNDEPVDRWSFNQLVKEMKRLLAFRQGMSVMDAAMLRVLQKQALKRSIDYILLYHKALQEGVQLTGQDEQKGIRLFLSRFPKRITLEDYITQENLKRDEFLKHLRRQLVVRKYMLKLTQTIPFTKKQVKKFYNKHYNTVTIRAKQIVIPIVKKDVEAAKVLALHVLKLAKKSNAGFVGLVRKYSQDPSKDLDGDIGELKKGDLLPALEKTLFSLQRGEVGGPVQTEMGFHILKVVHRKSPVPLGRVQYKIVEHIQKKKLEKILKKQLIELRSEGQIRILVPWGKE